MSCNGCRVLRKGCSESCILRPCLQWIGSPESQANATVFVAKFFGRAGLMSFISSVPESQRPALFQSLLFEACGRTVNPVNGAVGLLWTGNWHVCQQAVETVLRGGVLRPMAEIPPPNLVNGGHDWAQSPCFRAKAAERKAQPLATTPQTSDLDLCLSSGFRITASAQRRPETPSVNSDEGSVTTCSASGRDWAIPADRSGSSGGGGGGGGERRLLDLFV